MDCKDSLRNFENVTQKRNKLNLTEQNLITILQKIDNELNQTEVEWMHLKSLVESKQEAEKDIETPKHISTKPIIKDEHAIDDPAVNATQLNLSLGNSDKHMPLDEDDSD